MHKYILSGFNIYMKPLVKSEQARFIFRPSPIKLIKIVFFQLIILSVGCPLSFISCTSSAKKTAFKDSTNFIQLPANRPITEAEKKRLSDECQQWFDTTLDKTGFNGAVLVAKGGNIVFEKYKGSGHFGGKDTINHITPFHIASVSKTITAMAVLKLWQDGKLDIDEPFSKYFPNFNYEGITIRCLLNHRSGLPNYLYFMEDLGWNKKEYIKNQDVYDYLVNRKGELKNIGKPDSRFSYCNTNYALLALLIEKLSGQSYADYLQQQFFGPLNMKQSFVFKREDSAKVIPSYDWRGQMIPLNELDLVYGDKNIYSTVEDLLIWDQALLSNLILKPEVLKQAYTPYSNERAGIRNYGLGWRMNIYPDGKKMIYHNGWWHGYNASFIRLIEEDASIIVLGNRYSRAIYKAKNLANLFGTQYQNSEEEEGETTPGNKSISPKIK